MHVAMAPMVPMPSRGRRHSPLAAPIPRCSRSRLHGRQILDGDIFRGSAEGRKPQIDPCRLRS